MVDLARGDHGLGVRGTHPINSGMNIAVGYGLTGTDDHDWLTLLDGTFLTEKLR
jgi:hypothetical protein